MRFVNEQEIFSSLRLEGVYFIVFIDFLGLFYYKQLKPGKFYIPVMVLAWNAEPQHSRPSWRIKKTY